MGEEVANPAFTVKVERVDVATSLKSQRLVAGAPDVATDGLFVIVHLRAKSNQKPFSLRDVHLETPGGYLYSTEPRLGTSDLVAVSYEPLIWGPAVVSFEIPKSRLAGAHLVIGEARLLAQLSAETSVDLGIGRARAAALISHAAQGYQMRAGSP
jgi:hypothetical protein